MNFDKEEALISAVQKKKPLWQTTLGPEYRNDDNLKRLWTEVSDSLKSKCMHIYIYTIFYAGTW